MFKFNGKKETAKDAKAFTEKSLESAQSNAQEPTATSATADKVGDDGAKKIKVHNLLIIDASGSMFCIYNPTLTGMNETLQTIRVAQQTHPDQVHDVTLVTFNSAQFNFIYRHTPAAEAVDIKPEQYIPTSTTPLYDALGRSLTMLRSKVLKDDVVLVTIITDGYENASIEYNGAAIKKLIESLEAEGWVFTYIGANQDVEAVAHDLAIKNHMEFDASDEGANMMFDKMSSACVEFYGRISKSSKDDLQSGFFD
jgi:Mg-chelatase subunit ChlD